MKKTKQILILKMKGIDMPKKELFKYDVSRHLKEYDPSKFGNRRVDIIGCGAVGAGIANLMVRNGTQNIHLWDGDKIESHNVANQIPYVRDDIGKYKVDALREHLTKVGANIPTVHNKYVTESETLGEIVFLAVDTMAARKNIFQKCLKLKPSVKYVIECRMGVDELRVYGFCPYIRDDIKEWESSLYEDAKAVPGICQIQTTLNDVVSITASLAVARFRYWYRKEIVNDVKFKNELPIEQIMLLRPLTVLTK